MAFVFSSVSFYLFIISYFWLHQVFVALRRLSHCREQASYCGGFSCGVQALGRRGSVVVAQGLSCLRCLAACGPLSS